MVVGKLLSCTALPKLSATVELPAALVSISVGAAEEASAFSGDRFLAYLAGGRVGVSGDVMP